MKEQTFFIEKLDSGFLVTTAGKQHARENISDALRVLMTGLGDAFFHPANLPQPTSIEITIGHKVHYKAAEPNDDNDDNAGNHGV